MSAHEIQLWIRDYLAKTLNLPADTIDIHAAFERLGIDSVTAVGLVGDVEAWLGIEIDPTLPYDFPTISSLSTELARLTASAQATSSEPVPVDA